MVRVFPKDFQWGCASSAYQTEGAVQQDGRSRSIWDDFCEQPGRIADGTSGQVACDSYNRFDQDLAALTQLGVQAYRFSLAWPRIQPSLSGPVNNKGLDHYQRVVDALLSAGIEPVPTLYHWDLPSYLDQLGGWTNREVALRFGDFAQIVASRLADRVKTFMTINEPWCAAFLGYANGEQAPGWCDPPAALKAAHHLNLAHGLASLAIQSHNPACQVTWPLNLQVFRPASDLAEDAAAIRQLEEVANDIWLLPMLEGHYSPALFKDTAHLTNWSFVADGDLALIHQPDQPLSLNYYSSQTVRRRPGGQMADPGPFVGAEAVEILPPSGPLTDMGWGQDPAGLTQMLLAVHRRWPNHQIYLSENGAAFVDQVGPDGQVHDAERIAFLTAHLEALGQAMDLGVPVRGYMVWSLLDNFEWIYGQAKRFGLYRTDYQTMQRTPKDSAHWYRQVVATGQLEVPPKDRPY